MSTKIANAAKTNVRKVTKKQTLTRLIEESIAKGANTAEEIHRAVLELPVSVLDSMGLEDAATEVRKIQDRTIGAVYELIHDINHRVADLAADILDEKSGGRK